MCICCFFWHWALFKRVIVVYPFLKNTNYTSWQLNFKKNRVLPIKIISVKEGTVIKTEEPANKSSAHSKKPDLCNDSRISI